jgi:hypothetical protein
MEAAAAVAMTLNNIHFHKILNNGLVLKSSLYTREMFAHPGTVSASLKCSS